MDIVSDTGAPPPSGGGTGDFFAVDRRAWARVCGLGMNPAVAYLVLARGTGGDNRTTKWSAKAVKKYTEISRSRAPLAIAELERAKAVVKTVVRNPDGTCEYPQVQACTGPRDPGLRGLPATNPGRR